jgi:LmbE family N-acetylglucosaminyl deacetylase
MIHPKRLSLVFAHPDDESFATGGIISKYAEEGVLVNVLCATRGEAGSTGNPPICTTEELPLQREKELKEACTALGVNVLTLLNYNDKTLNLHEKELAGEIQSYLIAKKPDTIITFPPSGISGHPDHIAIQKATLEAVQSLDFPVQLYYVVIPESLVRSTNRQIHTVPDDEITEIIDIVPYKNKMAAALRAHLTQHQSIQRVFPGVWEGTSNDSLPSRQYLQLAWEKQIRAHMSRV